MIQLSVPFFFSRTKRIEALVVCQRLAVRKGIYNYIHKGFVHVAKKNDDYSCIVY
jgi:hypothetical protein